MIPLFLLVLVAGPTVLFLTSQSATANGTTAGQFVVQHPTLSNLGFEWAITGDANRNASVSVEYRAVGETEWRQALPLVRIGGERTTTPCPTASPAAS